MAIMNIDCDTTSRKTGPVNSDVWRKNAIYGYKTESVTYSVSYLFAEMTGTIVLIAYLFQFRSFLAADFPGITTAGVKVATVRTIDGGWYFTLQRFKLFTRTRVGDRN